MCGPDEMPYELKLPLNSHSACNELNSSCGGANAELLSQASDSAVGSAGGVVSAQRKHHSQQVSG